VVVTGILERRPLGDWDRWTWDGSSGLVALGMLALAGVTSGLVWMTRGLVTATAPLAK
jgi:hypothetical protein